MNDERAVTRRYRNGGLMACALLAIAASRRINAEDWVYTVRPGDNLWNLSARHLTAIAYWKRLQAINHIIDPLNIPPGTKLRIPVPWLKKFPMLARVAAIVGKVEVFDEETGKATPATAGSYLVLGDAVRTDKDSNTTLGFVDGSRVLLQSASYFQIAREPGFLRPVIDRSNVADNGWPADRTLPLGRYFWRVAYVDVHEGEGPYSDPQEFRRVMPAPEIGEPDIGDDKLVVRWRAGLPGQRYHVQWSEHPDCASPLIDLRTGEPFLAIERPDPGEYFIRVQTIEQDGFIGPFGAPRAIDVPSPDLYWWLLVLPLFGLLAL